MRHYNIPFDDLIDCIIDRDMAEVAPDKAAKIRATILSMKDSGIPESDCVDIFCTIFSNAHIKMQSDNLVDEIEGYLEDK
jgi:hypothetical protein